MNTYTGEIKHIPEPEKVTQEWKLIDPALLPERLRSEMEATGRTQLSRNSPCPCGSRKRFKKCCFTARNDRAND